MSRRTTRRPRFPIALYRKRPGGASAPDAPALPAGAVAWYRASDLAAGPVAAWPDASGSGHPLAVPGFGTAPAYLAASAANGKPAVRFDGVANALQAAFALTQPATFLLVVARHNWPVHQAEGTLIDGAGSNTARLFSYLAAGCYTLYAGAYGPTNYPGGPVTAPFLATAAFAGAASALGFGGGTPSGGDPGTAAPGGVTLASYGGAGSPTTNADCDLCELIVYPRVLSAADLTQAQTYLMTWYGLA